MQRIAILIMAAAGAAFSAYGQAKPDPSALTPEAAVELAVSNNRSLARDRVDLTASQRALGRSWNGVLPGVTLSAAAARASATDAVTTYGLIGASVTLSPLVLDAVDEARIAYESQTLAYRTSLRNLELQVRKSFYKLVLARENIAVQTQSVETARKIYERAETRRKAGLASELEALSAQVNMENLKPNLENAQMSYDNQLASFKQLLGLDQTKDLALKGSLAEASGISNIDFSGLKGEPPAVQTLKKSLESALAKRKTAQARILWPALTLSGSYKPTSNSTLPGAWSDSGSLSAIFSFSLDNLLPWSAARETADKAQDTVVKQESQLSEAETTAELSFQSLRREIEQSLSTLKARRLTVTLAERTYLLTEEAYKLGTKDILSLQSAADNLAQARVNLMDEAYTLISALLDLEYALGVPFGTIGR